MLDLTSREKIVVMVGFIFAVMVTIIVSKLKLSSMKSKCFEAVVLRIMFRVGLLGASFGIFILFAMLFGFYPW